LRARPADAIFFLRLWNIAVSVYVETWAVSTCSPGKGEAEA